MRHKSFLTMFAESVREVPDKTAVLDEKQQMTYRELYESARIVGYGLNRMMQGRTQRPIVLFMDKSCICLTAMLGVLNSGNIYVPMDVKTPLDRLTSILETLESAVVISSEEDRKYLDKMGYQGEIVLYEELMEQYSAVSSEEIDSVLAGIEEKGLDTDLMYILFTSGSTGVPKGVAVMHRSLMDYVYAYKKAVVTKREDIVGNQTPFYADMSLKDIYMSLEVGATICIIPQKYFMAPKKLLQYLDDNRVSFISWVPTAYRIVAQFDALEKVCPKFLNRFLFSGESMPIAVYEYWRRHYPDAIYIQQYGPTEITGACTSFQVSGVYAEDETIPIGKPFDNTGIILLDEDDREVPCGDTEHMGEICVFGTCLAAGYYNNPEKTAEVFVRNPLKPQIPSLMYRTGDLAKWDADGNLVFVTRKDYQVKHGGKRIELGEIEAAVLRIPDVKACCCVHRADKDALVLYYIGELEGRDITEQLQTKLPKYMIPTTYNRVAELPVLPNGKLDRKRMAQWALDEENKLS
ncbi:MAG: amino acid adenylation domain-containing protein [Muribaculum sp.]|nr:amino acid adenylation domain-containing protein [Muribaculum sp.]